MIRKLLSLLLAFGLWPVATGLGAGPLDSVFQKVEQAPWGEKQSAVKKGLSPLLTNKTILIVADDGLRGPYTLNYLFKEKGGGLYNLAWYRTTPVSSLKVAVDADMGLEKALRAKYGQPKISRSDGKLENFKEVEKKMAARDATMAFLKEAEKAKGSPLDGKEIIEALAGSGHSMMDIMPTLFYSKLNFWDGGQVWVVTNFLCSNDGSCYQHLQFVSKDQTKDEPYAPTPEKLFSYTPLDRDQDAVTKFNRSLSQ